MSQNNKKRSR